MKRVILSLIALSTVGSLALPVQAKNISPELTTVETEQTNLKGHKKHGHGNHGGHGHGNHGGRHTHHNGHSHGGGHRHHHPHHHGHH